MRLPSLLRITTIATLLSTCRSFPAFADGSDPAAAEELFREGRRALLDGKVGSACAMFQESYERDPSPGAMLNLGDCEERLGQVASAWQRFRQLARQLPKGDERRQIAEQRAAALAPRIPHLRILPPAGNVDGIEIRRDGIEVSGPTMGMAMPVDPGSHAIVVRAPGHVTRRIEVSLEERESLDVRAEPGPVERTAYTPPSRADEMTTAGFAIGGAGMALLGVGGVLGIAALENGSEADSLCNSGTCTNDRAARLRDTAHTEAMFADVLGGTGLVAAGVGAYLVIHAKSMRVATASNGLVLKGTW